MPSKDNTNIKVITKPIEGYEGLYTIDTLGRIFSSYTNRYLKPSFNDKGYLIVSLQKNKKQSKPYVHRLIAKAFIDNPENKPFINHIDGVKTNNSPCNLEWCTQQENIRHACETGLIKCKEMLIAPEKWKSLVKFWGAPELEKHNPRKKINIYK